MEAELAGGTYRELRRVSWDEFSKDHVSKIAGGKHADEAERSLRFFAEACHPASPSRVTFTMIESLVGYLRKRGNALASINKRLRYINHALRMAVKRGYATKNPMDQWRWEREEQKLPRVLTEAEKTKLLDACPTAQWRTFVFVALTSGCRLSELSGLTWNRVDFDNTQLVVTGTKAKRDRLQPLNPESMAMLRESQAVTLVDGGPFASIGTRSKVAHGFKRIVAKAGIAPCTFHDLRRTFCTDLARLGVNQLVVQKLAGHADASTTARYYQLVDDRMKRDAVARLGQSAG